MRVDSGWRYSPYLHCLVCRFPEQMQQPSILTSASPAQLVQLWAELQLCLRQLSEGGGSYLITGIPGATILPPGSSPLPVTNDNLLFYPGTPSVDAGGYAAYFTALGPAFAFVVACGALGPGYNGCAVEAPDSTAIDGYIILQRLWSRP